MSPTDTQLPPPNTDESKVPTYTLPALLKHEDGSAVSAESWPRRRSELLSLFERHVYGRAPDRPGVPRVVRTETDPRALAGRAVRKQFRLALTDDGPEMDLLVYLPAEAAGPVPVFLGLNFYGNQTVHADAGIWLPARPVRNNAAYAIEGGRAGDASRGRGSLAWPVEMILSRGYGLATVHYGDIELDHPEAFDDGLRRRFLRPGQTRPDDDQWGAIAAWAWGLSRAMDVLVQDADIDAARVAVLGHSRLGKTALWAGATDARFAMAVSNNSGCGGAALSRRRFGETVAHINTTFPHWFCGTFRQYNGQEDRCPVDQHMLLALPAPRPVYVASAEDDAWADPRGEFLSALHADPAYRLLGTAGLPATDMPPLNQAVAGVIGYHIRPGRHGLTEHDWRYYLDFADRHLR